MDAQIDRDAIAALENAGLPDGSPLQRFPSLQAAGRGAVSNPGVRFKSCSAAAFDDGWETLFQDVGELPRLDTTLTPQLEPVGY